MKIQKDIYHNSCKLSDNLKNHDNILSQNIYPTKLRYNESIDN